ncbi:hypothetical protein ACEE86_14865, partial [Proteus mirabilis]
GGGGGGHPGGKARKAVGSGSWVKGKAPKARKEFIARNCGIKKPTGKAEKEKRITSNQLDNTPSVSSKSNV